MAKKKIEAELTAYFKANIDNRIRALKDEISGLKAVRVKMFGKHEAPAGKPKPKRKLSAAHKKALDDGRKKALAAKNGGK